MQRRWKAFVLVAAGFWLLAAGGARAQAAPEGPSLTPPRLGLVSGDVWTWRPGDADWVPAQKNLPLAGDERLYAGSESRFEIQIGAAAFVRGGAGTEIVLEEHKTDFLRFGVSRGTISVDARDLGVGQAVELTTEKAEFRMDRAGYYRFDVDPNAVRLTTRAGGLATVKLPSGKLTVAGSGTRLVVDQGPATPVASETLDAPDEWDHWNHKRTADLLDTESARYVSAEVYGLRDLDDFGDWRRVPTYGHVWVPARIPAGWAPYSAGRWIWDPYYRWTWIDDTPWGWAPFHYGRWVYLDGFWAWAPGPQFLAPVYSPALVAFFGSGPVRVGFGFSAVSWVALGWGEPLYPWWGPPYYIGRPCWRGWGGPRHVKHRPGRHGHHHDGHPHHVDDYENGRVRDAVRHLPPDRFLRDRPNRTRPPADALRDATPLRGELPMQPPERNSAVRSARAPLPERLRERAETRGRVPARASSAPPLPSAGRPPQDGQPVEVAARSGAERRYPGGRAPSARDSRYEERRSRDAQRRTVARRTDPPPLPDSARSAPREDLSHENGAARRAPRDRAVPERLRDRAADGATTARQAPPPPGGGDSRSSATTDQGTKSDPAVDSSRRRARPNRPGASAQTASRERPSLNSGSGGWSRQPDRSPAMERAQRAERRVRSYAPPRWTAQGRQGSEEAPRKRSRSAPNRARDNARRSAPR